MHKLRYFLIDLKIPPLLVDLIDEVHVVFNLNLALDVSDLVCVS